MIGIDINNIIWKSDAFCRAQWMEKLFILKIELLFDGNESYNTINTSTI